MKFLVIWKIDVSLLSKDVLRAVMSMPDYAEPLMKSGKVAHRWHIPGAHGGAWVYDVASNEELDLLLARSPVFNFARYEVIPLADMAPPGKSPG